MIDDNRVHVGGVFERPTRSNLPPTFQQLRVHTDWRTSWTHVVGGKFSAAHDDAVLFYEGGTGFAEIYETDGHGNISLLRQHADLGRSLFRSHRWTQIVVGRFSNSANSSLLLVDANKRFAATFNVDSTGNLVRLREFPNWGAWTHVTVVRVPGSNYSAVLRYNQSTGRGEILTCDGTGGFAPRQASDGWRRSWTHVVGGFASGTSVLFYEASTGHCEIYNLEYNPADSNTDVHSLGKVVSVELPPGASVVVGGSFGLDSGYGLYYPGSGLLQFVYATDFINNGFNIQEQYAGLGSDWDLIAAAGFWTPDDEDYKFREGRFSSLLFYDRDAGRGEFFLHSPLAAYEHSPLAGYASRGSVKPGESIEFCVSSAVGPYSMRIYRLGRKRELVAEVLNHSSGAHPLAIPILGYRFGPGWTPAATVRIPDHWPSGLYVAHVTAGGIVNDPGTAENVTARRARLLDGQHQLDIPFVVRAPESGSQSKILVFVNDTTYEAYNFWGRSLYGFRSFGSSQYTSPGAGAEVMPRGLRVSFRRPFIGETPFVGKKWIYWEEPLAQWLDRLEIGVEWATLVDLHEDPRLLDAYDMVVSTGHAEYFSQEMYDRLQAFIARGGNAAFFSGNNCWWRIRIEDGGDTMVCYKKDAFDPASVKTINWTEQESGALVGTTLGAVLSAWPPDGSHSRDDDDGKTAHFVVRAPDHWVFAGTALAAGDEFGTFGDGGTVVGYETDFRSAERNASWTELADVRFAPKDSGFTHAPEIATMMIHEKGGAMFTASTVDWTIGLSQDPAAWSTVDQITLNLFVRFGGLGAACDIVGFDSDGDVQVDFTNIGFRSSWDVMLAGAFTRSDRDQLVLYDRAGGALAIVGFDNSGRANLDRTDDTIGSNWTSVVAGNFIGNGRKQVLLYDKSSGDTLLVGFDGTGHINLRCGNSGWRTSWDLITVGPFIGNRRDQVLLYDRGAGTADIVGFDNSGNVNLDTSNTGWRSSWDWMVPGHFFGNATDEVWLGDRAGDVGEIVAFDGSGNFRSLEVFEPFGSNRHGAIAGDFMDLRQGREELLRYGTPQGSDADIQSPLDGGHDIVAGDWMGRAWNLLVAGRFTGASRTEYLRYIAADGFAEMWGIEGIMTRLQEYSGWRSSWVLAASGRFLGNGRDQLALYDRGRF